MLGRLILIEDQLLPAVAYRFCVLANSSQVVERNLLEDLNLPDLFYSLLGLNPAGVPPHLHESLSIDHYEA